ncbi:MAG: hypothetical protein Q7S50_03245 [bacterium]|nr:hypothetical protein [bacterium]
MKMPFFLNRFWPTVVLVLMTTTYLTGVKYGMSTSNALAAAAWTGFVTFLLVVGVINESGGRHRMDNPIALWVTSFMAFAPVGPAAYSGNVYLSVLIVIATVLMAGAIVYLLERAIIGGRKGLWSLEYGLVPLGVVFAAGLEVSGKHEWAGALLAVCWFLHFFFKQIPQLLASVGIMPLRSGG